MDDASALADLVAASATAGEVIPRLLAALPRIVEVQLLTLEITPPSQLGEEDRAAVVALSPPALELRSEYGVPFWTALMLTAAHGGNPLPEGVLRAASFHQVTADASRAEKLAAGKVSALELQGRAAALADNTVLGLASRVLLEDGTHAHLPMLDFRLRPGPANLTTAVSAAAQLGIPGILLDSGNSYHFYGLTLLGSEELQVFLARALLFAPLIDHRWIAHQLIEGFCLLRVSRGTRAQNPPTAVAVIPPPPH